MGVEAKIVIGFSVKEWREKDLSSLVENWDEFVEDDDTYGSIDDIYKVLEMDGENMELIVPHEYDGFEEDTVIGYSVLDVYGSAEEFDINKVSNSILETQTEFKERFGFEGKVYFGAHDDD